jgi:hypothetical protein
VTASALTVHQNNNSYTSRIPHDEKGFQDFYFIGTNTLSSDNATAVTKIEKNCGSDGGGSDNLGDHTATQGVLFHKVTGAAAPTK